MADFCTLPLSVSEYTSLWALYNSTAGENWTWAPSSPAITRWHFPSNLSVPCRDHWQGLQCNTTDDPTSCSIVELSLSGYNLQGQLPSSLTQLSLLQELQLDSNHLTGTIPIEYGSFQVLSLFELYSNSLTGAIPSQLGLLTALQVLTLYTNHLSGAIPSTLGQLTNLHYLYLYSNQLTQTIPMELGSLFSIQNLYLDLNYLTSSIPSELGHLASLQNLGLYFNSLSGIMPTQLATLSALQELILSSNELSGPIPCELGRLDSLRYLYLYSNQLTSQIPSELGNCSKLQELVLFSNCLSGVIPEALSQCKEMLFLALYENSLTFTIPSQLGSLQSMQYLVLYSNRLTGGVPSELGQINRLQEFSVSFNSLTGTIPDAVIAGNADSLSYFFVQDNLLSGSVLSELTQDVVLTDVFLARNYFTGLVTFHQHSVKLQTIVASSNFFSGPLPVLQSSAFLQSVDLSDNLLTGQLGSSFQNCSVLQSLALGGNSLTGTIPGYFESLLLLRSFNLSRNAIAGDLSVLDSATGFLQSVDLSVNSITGTLPASLFTKPHLQSVLLFSNCFSGTLPSTICSNSFLENLVLDSLASSCGANIPKGLQSIFSGAGSQKLMSGTIPSCIWRTPNLRLLHLTGNGLTGSIGNLDSTNQSNLQGLVVSSNRLTGTIPTWILTSTKLTQMDLSENRLSGTLLSSLKMLPVVSLYGLSVNRLSGKIPASFRAVNESAHLDVLNGNLFSCTASSGPSSWGVGQPSDALPPSDPAYFTYTCGSSLFDESLLFSILAFGASVPLLAVIVKMSTRLDSDILKRKLRDALIADKYLTLWVRSVLWAWWRIWFPVLVALLVMYILFKSIPSLHENSTHADQYLWITTAAFLHGWSPTLVILLGLVFCMMGILSLNEDSEIEGIQQVNNCPTGREMTFSSEEPSQKVRTYLELVGFLLMYLLNFVIVLTTNAAYVVATVNGMPENRLFAVQFFLGCFKLAWNDIVIPRMLGLFLTKHDRVPHWVFMSLFAIIGGPFVSTFFSASNCFLYAIIPQGAVTSTITVPQFSCSEDCFLLCEDRLCTFSCLPTCSFSPVDIIFDTVPPWVYSYQCSSTLLLDYIPVMVATMAISAILLPSVVIYSCCYSEDISWLQLVLQLIALRKSVKQNELWFVCGQKIRVKILINATVLLTFGLASPIVGVMVLLDSLAWCLVWHLLTGRQLNVVRSSFAVSNTQAESTTTLPRIFNDSLASLDTQRNVGRAESCSTFTDEAYSQISNLSWHAMKEAEQKPMDYLTVFSFVGVFWSLFVFDMIGDAYGDLKGGLSMLAPLLVGLVIWLVRFKMPGWSKITSGVCLRRVENANNDASSCEQSDESSGRASQSLELTTSVLSAGLVGNVVNDENWAKFSHRSSQVTKS